MRNVFKSKARRQRDTNALFGALFRTLPTGPVDQRILSTSMFATDYNTIRMKYAAALLAETEGISEIQNSLANFTQLLVRLDPRRGTDFAARLAQQAQEGPVSHNYIIGCTADLWLAGVKALQKEGYSDLAQRAVHEALVTGRGSSLIKARAFGLRDDKLLPPASPAQPIP